MDTIRINGQCQIAAVVDEKQDVQFPGSVAQRPGLGQGLFHGRCLVAILENPDVTGGRRVQDLHERSIRSNRRVEDHIETCKKNGSLATGGHEPAL